MVLIRSAIQEMERNNIHQWDEIYPDKDIILSDINAGNLYAAIENRSIVGIVTLNEEQPSAYGAISWSSKIRRPLVVHRLCVEPDFQRRGVAKYLMRYAEKYGLENNYGSIRLDAFIDNRMAVGLYDSLDYERKGIVRFRKGRFYCYEKLL